MDRNRCPACGASGYRGGRCDQCLYKPFGRETDHSRRPYSGGPVSTPRPGPMSSGRSASGDPGGRKGHDAAPGPLRMLLKPLGILAAIAVAGFVPGGVLLVIIAALILRSRKR